MGEVNLIERVSQTISDPLTREVFGTEDVLILRVKKEDGTYHRTTFTAKSAARTLTEVEAHLQRLGEQGLTQTDKGKIDALVGELFDPRPSQHVDSERPSVLTLTLWERLKAMLRIR